MDTYSNQCNSQYPTQLSQHFPIYDSLYEQAIRSNLETNFKALPQIFANHLFEKLHLSSKIKEHGKIFVHCANRINAENKKIKRKFNDMKNAVKKMKEILTEALKTFKTLSGSLTEQQGIIQDLPSNSQDENMILNSGTVNDYEIQLESIKSNILANFKYMQTDLYSSLNIEKQRMEELTKVFVEKTDEVRNELEQICSSNFLEENLLKIKKSLELLQYMKILISNEEKESGGIIKKTESEFVMSNEEILPENINNSLAQINPFKKINKKKKMNLYY